MREWFFLAYVFEKESGLKLRVPEQTDVEIENCACTVSVENLTSHQLCRTPVCVKPNNIMITKQHRCQDCNCCCCDCENCERFRAFFGIRTALINMRKVSDWDTSEARMIKEMQLEEEKQEYSNTVRQTMEMLYHRFKLDHPQLPMYLTQMNAQEPLYRKLRILAVKVMEGDVEPESLGSTYKVLKECRKIHDAALRTYNVQQLRMPKKFDDEDEIKNWLRGDNYEKGVKFATEGGSDVVVSDDHNMEDVHNDEITNSDKTIEP